MANRGRPSVNKRRKEEARRLKKQAKAQRMAERAAEKGEKQAPPGEDPDIAGIVPGPQPLPEEMRDGSAVDDGESEEEEAER